MISPKMNNTQSMVLISKGFTLLETVIVLAILFVIASIAIPTFMSSLRSWEAKELQSHVLSAIKIAKSQSLIYRQNNIMCIANANNVCDKNATEYLLVFSDIDNNNRYDSDINKIIVKQALNLDYGRLYLRAANRNYIKFYADTGLPRGHFGHIKHCPNNGEENNMYQISLNQQGNHRIKPYSFKVTGCP